MSLVLGYAYDKKAIIMSDGRAGGNVSPSETYDKTRKINNNIILGFVGYKETSEHFLNCVYGDMEDTIESCFIDEFLEEVQYGMGLDSTKEKLKSTFLIIGKTKLGKIRHVIIGEDTHFRVKEVYLNKLSFIGGTVPLEDIREICRKHFSNETSPCMMMKKIIEDVSEIDNSINKNIFIKTIEELSEYDIQLPQE